MVEQNISRFAYLGLGLIVLALLVSMILRKPDENETNVNDANYFELSEQVIQKNENRTPKY